MMAIRLSSETNPRPAHARCRQFGERRHKRGDMFSDSGRHSLNLVREQTDGS